jgi:hypothetical protein
MAISKLEKTEWRPFFDRLSKGLPPGNRAEVEVFSLGLGDQIEAEWVPMIGIVYDHKDDLIEIALEGLDHMIRHPVQVYVDEGDAGVQSMEVINSEDVREIVKLREPVKVQVH